MKIVIEFEDTSENADEVAGFLKEMNDEYTTVDVDALHPDGWAKGMTGMRLVNAKVTIVKN